jgi:Ca2+-binding RTX toxin-like protein
LCHALSIEGLAFWRRAVESGLIRLWSISLGGGSYITVNEKIQTANSISNDTIYGGNGNDREYGGPGSDRLSVQNGNAFADGGCGRGTNVAFTDALSSSYARRHGCQTVRMIRSHMP